MNCWIRILFFLSLFLIPPLTVAAGNPRDTVKGSVMDTLHVKYYTGELFKPADQKDPYSLKGFEHYDLRGYLGNTGQAVTNYYVDHPVDHLGFRYFNNDFAANLINNDSVRYFDTHHPYTNLFFIAGQQKEANFSFTHTQNINKNLNFAAYFKRIRSDGTYLQQATNLTTFYISSNYKSPGRRYYLLANVIYNVDKPQVNGGIKNDSTLEYNTYGTDRKVIPVNLMGAQRRYRERAYNMTQFFNLGFQPAMTDSTHPPRFCPTSAFSLSTKVSDEAITYSDLYPDSGYYSNQFYSTLLTHDSVYFYRIRNALGWNTWEKKRSSENRKLGMYVNVENELIRINQLAGDTVIMNWVAKAGIFTYSDTSRSRSIKLTGEYGLAGYNSGDYRGELSAQQGLFKKRMYVGINGVASLARPDFMSEIYSSNNFIWRNHFEKEGIYSGKAFLRSDKYFFELGAFARQENNPVFYTSEALPWQLSSAVNMTGAYAYKELNMGRWCFSNRVTWQSVPVTDAVRFPEWVTDHSLYYHHNIKKILYYQLGVDVFYFSSYYAKIYMPATGQFYVQDQKAIGNYPYGDVFLNVQVRTVRVFVKYEHVNSGFPSFAYYAAPHYPVPDRSLKFGVSWIFNN